MKSRRAHQRAIFSPSPASRVPSPAFQSRVRSHTFLTALLTVAAFTAQWGLLLIAGCSPAPHKPVIGPDFSTYTVTEHRIGCWEMTRRCLPDVPFPVKPLLVTPLGCAEIDFERRTCDIYTCWYSPGFILTHERLHCQGMDHFGTLQRGWDQYIDQRIKETRATRTVFPSTQH